MQPVNEAVPGNSDASQANTMEESFGTQDLTAADRCDVCGAQAYIRVVLTSGELMFCSHHGNEKKDQLSPVALSWQDETEKLLSR